MSEKTTTIRFHQRTDPDILYNERDKSRDFPSARYDPNGIHESWRGMSEREAYDTCFGGALERYNAKQKRKDRRMTMDEYMESVRADKRGRINKKLQKQGAEKCSGKHTSYELVMSVGNCKPPRDDNGLMIRGEHGERLTPHRLPDGVNKAIMRKYYETWAERNPTLYLYNVQYHADGWFLDKRSGEMIYGIDHIHMAYIPIGHGYNRGMSEQCSVGRALSEMGFDDIYEPTDDPAMPVRLTTAYELWERRERAYIEELTAEYAPGWTIEHPYAGTGADEVTVAQYRKMADLDNEIDDLNYELDDRVRLNDCLIDEHDRLVDENASLMRQNAQARQDLIAIEDYIRIVSEGLSEDVQPSLGVKRSGRHGRDAYVQETITKSGVPLEEHYQKWKTQKIADEQAERDKARDEFIKQQARAQLEARQKLARNKRLQDIVQQVHQHKQQSDDFEY